MNELIEPTCNGGFFTARHLEEELKKEGKNINFCKCFTLSEKENGRDTKCLGVYSQKGERGIFVRDQDGRELHMQGKYTGWWPINAFLLGGEMGIVKDYQVDLYHLPKLRRGIGMTLEGGILDSPSVTRQKRAIILFSFLQNSKRKVQRADWVYETKDPDDYH